MKSRAHRSRLPRRDRPALRQHRRHREHDHAADDPALVNIRSRLDHLGDAVDHRSQEEHPEDRTGNRADAAAQAGVKRFVMVSYFGAGPDHGVPQGDPFFPYAEAKAAADAHLRASDLDWTVLGPGRLTLDAATGRIELGKGKGEVSRADVALVVAAALADDSTIGRTIDFNNGDIPIAEALAR